ncbi:GNAT family N-acetyltransferase [Neorhizobium sp. AL 9.2.2]|uniref:GNAT family N-acetyltransferase n=1 Tax=Neorhizobium sp. AL 9.2.2 TaxID=2712894 RepID=UPI00157170E7|nr:GNAT family N-acetyltransferase [Neorhizobium sp. AL 9.2.2]NSY17605.1 GNAT family N-acetyltransferase [Neorhizobium sp. AL 9.2.2]
MDDADTVGGADGVTIEPLRDEYIEGFHKALDIVCRERRYMVFLRAPPIDEMRDFVRESVAAGNPHIVAVADGEVVGWCDIRRLERDVHAHRGLLGMGIIPGFRDRGLGRRLIVNAVEAANRSGIHRVELDVHADNHRAIALYRKVGFQVEGVARDALKIDGCYLDSVRMALIFT